jgi:hypothetical protein
MVPSCRPRATLQVQLRDLVHAQRKAQLGSGEHSNCMFIPLENKRGAGAGLPINLVQWYMPKCCYTVDIQSEQ